MKQKIFTKQSILSPFRGLGLAILLLITTFTATAQTQIGTSTTYWQIDNGVLTISGTGDMPDLEYTAIPWSTDRTSITSLVIESGVTSIGNFAFSLCSKIVSAEIPNGVTRIGEGAFNGCSGLTSVNLPNSLENIEAWAFSRCSSLESEIVIPDGVTTIPMALFQYCKKLSSVILPNSVTGIGDFAFSDCSQLRSINLPNQLDSIGHVAFQSCTALSAIHIPASVTNIKQKAFNNCSNLSISVDENNTVYAADNGALLNKEKTILHTYQGNQSYTIPNTVTSIGAYAFYGNTSLESITIPYSVTNIGTKAFHYCSALASVTVLHPNPANIIFDDIYVFSDIAANPTLTVPTSAVSLYEEADVWKNFNVVGGGLLVTAVCNNQKGSTGSENKLYTNGEQATLTATPNAGCKFVNWTVNGTQVSTENPYSFAVTEDLELTANFEALPTNQYTITAVANNNDYGTVSGSGNYEENTEATLTATPNTGYQFVNWTVNGTQVSTENPYSFAVAEDIELTANFRASGTPINEINKEQEISIYPNPAADKIYIRTQNGNIPQIKIFNLQGSLLQQTQATQIDLSNYANGTYLIEINNTIKKIIKK